MVDTLYTPAVSDKTTVSGVTEDAPWNTHQTVLPPWGRNRTPQLLVNPLRISRPRPPDGAEPGGGWRGMSSEQSPTSNHNR